MSELILPGYRDSRRKAVELMQREIDRLRQMNRAQEMVLWCVLQAKGRTVLTKDAMDGIPEGAKVAGGAEAGEGYAFWAEPLADSVVVPDFATREGDRDAAGKGVAP